MNLTQKDIEVILAFLSRVPLKGEEADTFVMLKYKLTNAFSVQKTAVSQPVTPVKGKESKKK